MLAICLSSKEAEIIRNVLENEALKIEMSGRTNIVKYEVIKKTIAELSSLEIHNP